jgi:hypothetical protein
LYLKTGLAVGPVEIAGVYSHAVLDHVPVAALDDRAGRTVDDLDALGCGCAELGGRELRPADVTGLIREPSDAVIVSDRHRRS